MAYSSITKKKCKCKPDCDRWPTLSCHGYNYAHLPEELKEKLGNKRQVAKRVRNKRLSIGREAHKIQREVEDADIRNWFLDRMATKLPICENCGAFKNDLTYELLISRWKSCQAHLLPKRHFKSLRTHELNGMVLGSGFSGLCFCHDTYDSNWEAASKMGIWSEVVRRFKIMYPLITATEHQYIPQQLLSTLKTP